MGGQNLNSVEVPLAAHADDSMVRSSTIAMVLESDRALDTFASCSSSCLVCNHSFSGEPEKTWIPYLCTPVRIGSISAGGQAKLSCGTLKYPRSFQMRFWMEGKQLALLFRFDEIRCS